jgi:hypothetical protein
MDWFHILAFGSLLPHDMARITSQETRFLFIFLQLSPAVDIPQLSWFVIREQLYKIFGVPERKLFFMFCFYLSVTRILTWKRLVTEDTLNKEYRMDNANILSRSVSVVPQCIIDSHADKREHTLR